MADRTTDRASRSAAASARSSTAAFSTWLEESPDISFSCLLLAVPLGQGVVGSVTGFAVCSVAVSAGVAGGSSEISQQTGGPVVAELGDGGWVGASDGRVEVRKADDGAVPAQDLEKQPLPHLVGCVADRVQQLVHGRHCSDDPRHDWLVTVGFGVGEVALLACNEGTDRA